MIGKTTIFDAAKYLDDADSQAALLNDALGSGNPAYVTHALGIVARARGMTAVAKEAGVTREALYRALSDDGDPKLSTLLGVVKALGVRLSATPDETPVATKAELSRDRSTRRMRVTSGSKAANG